MPVIWTAAEARTADREASERGVEESWLMEAAGAAVARAVMRRGARAVLVLAGPGKNGGDGLVAARRLASVGVEVAFFSGGRPPSALQNAALQCGARQVEENTMEGVLAGADLVVDAMFGTGVSRPLQAPWAGLTERVSAAAKPVLAVDLPSGVDADTGAILGDAVLPAVETVTFQALKPAHILEPGASLSGRISIADIGLPERAGHELALIAPEEFDWKGLEREPGAHKYQAGRVLVIGGSRPYAGAPALAGLAALRSGIGYVELYVPKSVEPGLRTLSSLPLVIRPGDECGDGVLMVSDELSERLRAARSVVLGPGLEAAPALVRLVRGCGAPVVVDAGAFASWKALGSPLWPTAIFTPHTAEAASLLDLPASWVEGHRMETVRRLARATGGIVVLKGRHTLAASPDGAVAVNLAGGSELATMGTGDVLAGVVAALLARGWTAWDAARAAVLWQGMAGEEARRAHGPFSVTAVDVADSLGAAALALGAGARPAEWPETIR